MSSRLVLAVLAASVACACSPVNEPIGVRAASFGEASKVNAAVQIINPDPVYAQGSAQPGDHGEKAAAAAERYRTDNVKEVQTIRTAGGARGGGGGGAGGGGAGSTPN